MRNSIQLTETEGTRPKKLLKGRDTSVNNFQELSQNLGLPVEQIFRVLIRHSRRSLNDTDCLTEDKERLEKMFVEQFNHLQIPVLAFQEKDVYDIYHARTTGEWSFRNSSS